MKDMNVNAEIGIGLAGTYRVQVVDSATKEVVKDYGWDKNLILNSGMDSVASQYIANVFTVGCIGTGTRQNYLTNSITTITQSGNYIGLASPGEISAFTQSAWDMYGTMSYASSVNIGDVIMDQDMSQSMVVLVSGSIMYVDTPYTYITPKTFTIWKTSQTLLQTDVHRSSTLFPGSSSAVGFNCGSFITASYPGRVVSRRTWDFPAETQTRSYSEVGVSTSTTPTVPLFSRVLFPSLVVVSPNQQLRMTYEMTTSYGPTTPVYGTASITGWPVLPSTNTYFTASIQRFNVTYVQTSGQYGHWTSYNSPLEPATAGTTGWWESTTWTPFASEDSTPLSNFDTASYRGTNASQVGGHNDAYVAGSFTRTKTATFSIYQIIYTVIRSLGFGMDINNQYGNLADAWDTAAQSFCMRFDQPQTKTSLQTLTVSWRWRWNRILQ